MLRDLGEATKPSAGADLDPKCLNRTKPIKAMYKTKSATQAYSMNVLPPLVLGLNDATILQGRVSAAYSVHHPSTLP